jgi:hypothetical protein
MHCIEWAPAALTLNVLGPLSPMRINPVPLEKSLSVGSRFTIVKGLQT